MRIELTLAAGMVAIMALAGATRAHADPVWYFDEGLFSALGTISQTTAFDGLDNNANTAIGANHIDGDLFLKGENGDGMTVVGKDTALNPIRNLVTSDNEGGYLNGDVTAAGYNLLSFRVANLAGYGDQVFMEVFTNLGSYGYGAYPHPAPEALSFYGFALAGGEYFTGFRMNKTDFGSNFEPTPIDQVFGITDIQLGKTGEVCANRICDGGGAVPEPGAWAMMILGFGLTGALVRRRRPVLRTA